MHQLHTDGPSAWVLTFKGNLVGHIIKSRGGYRAATPRGSYAVRATLASAIQFLKEVGK